MTRKETYELTKRQIVSLLEGETDRTAILANVTALLREAFPRRFFWVGFYMVKDGELLLGPFQGPVACMHIRKGRGVCGTAWERNETIIVPDVEQFPGHIACSSLSRSEIVVPLRREGQVIGVLDVDSRSLSAFNTVDKVALEEILDLLPL